MANSSTFGPNTGFNLSTNQPTNFQAVPGAFDQYQAQQKPFNETQKQDFLKQHGYSTAESHDLMAGRNPSLQNVITYPQKTTPINAGLGNAKTGLMISPANLQALRSQGKSDGEIATMMSQSSPAFAQKIIKVNQKFGNDPAAISAYLNTRFYGDPSYTTDPAAENSSKGYIGRTLDNIYNSANDVLGEGGVMQQYNRGEINAAQAAFRGATDIYHGALTPTLDALGTVAGAVADLPVIKPALQYAGSEFANSELGKQAIQAINSGVKSYSDLPASSPLRDLGASGKVAWDTAQVFMADQLANKTGVESAFQAATHPGETLKSVAGALTHPIDTLNAGRTALGSPFAPSQVATTGATFGVEQPKLTGPYKAFVQAGGDEKVAREIASITSPEQKQIMDTMTQKAAEGAQALNGTVEHRAIAGQQLINNADYIIQQRNIVGKALNGIVGTMADQNVDVTNVGFGTADAPGIFDRMKSLGVAFNENGQIESIARVSGAQKPILQMIADFFQPDETGRIVRSFKELDDFRSKLFDEIDAAKAGLSPTSGGQNVFSDAESIANSARSGMMRQMGLVNENYPRLAGAYAKLMNEPAPFFKALGYTGRMADLSTQDVRAAEIALRTMGNASAKPTEAIQKLLNISRQFGYQSPLDEMKLVQWADTLESIFPVTPARSLGGQVARAGVDVIGNVVKKKGLVAGIANSADQALGGLVDYMRGITPENRLRLLKDMLNATPAEISNVNSPIVQEVQGLLGGEQGVGSPQPILGAGNTSPSTVPEASNTVNSPEAFKNLTPEEIKSLTPEERSTGLLGGGGDNMPRGIPKSLQPLAEEAKKYASAEEFGNARMSPENMNAFRDAYNPNSPAEAKQAVTDFYNKATKEPSLSSLSSGEPDLAHMSLKDYEALRAKEATDVAKGMSPTEALKTERAKFVKGGTQPLAAEAKVGIAKVKTFSDLASKAKEMSLGDFVNKFSKETLPKIVKDDLVKLQYGELSKFSLEKVWKQFNPSALNPDDIPF